MKLANIYDSAAPYIACFVILRRGDSVAMVLRKNTGWMDGHYGLPAGKVEWNETYSAGAVREAKEEAGVDIQVEDLSFAHIGHRHSNDGKTFMEWVDVYFEVKKWDGEPHNAEPEKSERLDWLDLHNLPDNIVPSQREALKHITKGVTYSEYGWPS
ncbi:NUDIX domain-containing protein [bacterium]|nr:NUDIX domain-containing protein [bacterium]NBX98295.1 NUDIX domain-containing protein [bacterium]NDC94736.1 NUDIX domain-containing protein [bacterium]NDD84334.1 NUDIX domain-containing protein [bacterium]NDG30226.1 NUDIX domain-containing protein [bacterium]